MTTPTTQREADELLPCPFCGAKAELVDHGTGSWRAACLQSKGGCGATGRMTFDAGTTARSEWNRRAATDQPSAGQVDERAGFEEWVERNTISTFYIFSPDVKDSEYTDRELQIAEAAWKASRASLTPTAPQAASQQAASIRTLEFVSLMNAWRNADPLTAPAAYDAITAHIDAKLRAPQAATTASAPTSSRLEINAESAETRMDAGFAPDVKIAVTAPVQAAQPALPADVDLHEVLGLCDTVIHSGDQRRLRTLASELRPKVERAMLAAPGAAQTTDAREGGAK